MADPRLDAPVQGPPVPPPPPPPMQRGETNSQRVRELQTLLKDLKLLKTEPDGDFGRTTERAIIDFQSQYTGADGQQLPVTGVADPMTMRALRDYKAYVDEQRRNPRPQLPDELVQVEPNFDGIGSVQVLRLGARGPEVTRAQNLLRALGYPVEVTNVFDEPTRAAVADFQALYTLAMG
ncbi:MAG TPA: peptidoglycan-binding domain-containing protein, partial [Myxococcota bacterium]|nr:peptidoglycan-binding domain-containing protein [Myxococcota bacterium]